MACCRSADRRRGPRPSLSRCTCARQKRIHQGMPPLGRADGFVSQHAGTAEVAQGGYGVCERGENGRLEHQPHLAFPYYRESLLKRGGGIGPLLVQDESLSKCRRRRDA